MFPQSFKSSPLLRAWLRRLGSAGVTLKLRHRLMGWDRDGAALFETPDGNVAVRSDATVLALGGASWPRLGSDGGWADVLRDAGVAVAPFQPANCGFVVGWSEIFRERFEGQPLKHIGLSFGDRSLRGEAIVTRHGLEGGGIYALSAPLRDAIAATGKAVLVISLQPDLPAAQLQRHLAAPRGKQSLSTFLRKAAKLSPVAIGLLREVAGDRLAGMAASELAALIQAVPVPLVAAAPLDRAISTAGGDIARRGRRRVHAASPARRVCRRRDARLGGANRRLSPASVILDRRGRGARCAGLVGARHAATS